MAGVLEPQEGEVSRPLNAAVGYFEQSYLAGLNDSNTVLEEIRQADPGGDPGRARVISGAMMFEQDEALKKISILSGGEKSRVVLGKIISSPVNLLLLDEPTNHLDMEASDALLAAIDNFDGAAVVVTHNEMFLHALAERLIVFQGDGILVYEGDYGRFLGKVGWQDEREPAARRLEERPVRDGSSPKDLRKIRSAWLAEKSRLLKPLEKKIAAVEAAIVVKENALNELNRALVEPGQGKKGPEILEISRTMHGLQEDIRRLFGDLEALTEEYEEKKARFARGPAAPGD
jgi:ATP-binding cassette subfamily F protein 3